VSVETRERTLQAKAEIAFEEFHDVIAISQRHGQTDGQTTFRSNKRNRF